MEVFDNLRTLAATYLFVFAKYIDGSLVEILAFCCGVLGGVATDLPPYLVLMMLGVLARQVVARKDETRAVLAGVCGMLGAKELPLGSEDGECTAEGYAAGVEYLMMMVMV